jgi:hypothetical protein
MFFVFQFNAYTVKRKYEKPVLEHHTVKIKFIFLLVENPITTTLCTKKT